MNSYLPKKVVFLSGPMRGISRIEGITWREKARKLLGKDFEVLHAYRGREEKETFPDPRGAIIRDKNDIIRSDIVIVNDTIANAKVVILFGHAHDKDYWLNYHSHIRVSLLEEACELVKKMFSE